LEKKKRVYAGKKGLLLPSSARKNSLGWKKSICLLRLTPDGGSEAIGKKAACGLYKKESSKKSEERRFSANKEIYG